MGSADRWQKRGDGSYAMPEKQSEFLDWLLSDTRIPSSQVAWAREHDVNEKTVREWKKDRRFLDEWDRRAAEKNVSTERVQKVLDTLWKVGVEQGDVVAMSKWLEYSNRMRPPTTVVKDDQYGELSDEELVKQLAAELGFEDG